MNGTALPWSSTTLTPIQGRDLEILNAWQNDPEIRDLIMGFRGPVRLETTEAWIRNLAEQNLKTRVVFAVRQQGPIKGVAQLQAMDWLQRHATLGVYVGGTEDRGAGIGRVAVCLLLDYAFRGLDLHRVALEVIADNAPARRLYESLGFVQEGVLRQAYLRDGRREDVALYGLLKPEFTLIPPAGSNRLVAPGA